MPEKISLRRPLIGGAAVGGVILVILFLWRGPLAGRESDGGGETFTVTHRSVASTVAAIGTVKPRIGAEVRVGSRISGRVRRLGANIGDRVERGQVIATLESEELDAIVQQRRAELRVAAAVRAASDSVSPQAIASAEADVARYEASHQLAAAEASRQEELLRLRVSSAADAESARERLAAASAQREAARRALARIRVEAAQERNRAAADEARAQATLQSALVQRSFADITAPISGIVASVATQEGETVAAGLSAPTFLTIVDLERLQVDAYIDEVDIGKIEVGQRATFTVDAFPMLDFEGSVTAIYPTATIQDNVVKYVVVVSIAPGGGEGLRPEMTASVRVLLDERSALAIPSRAVRREGGRSVVYVQEGRRAVAREVRLGWREGAWVEVVSGLTAGEVILVDPPAPGADRI